MYPKGKNSSTLATSCEELTHWKRLWFWEGLGAGGEGDDSGWDGWMTSPTLWIWVWVNSGSLWWTERPGVLQFMGSQSVGHDWATELNWTEVIQKSSLMLLAMWGYSKKDGYLWTRKQVLMHAQSCLTLWDPMDCSLLWFSVHGIFQAKILKWVAISYAVQMIMLLQLDRPP